MSSPDPLHHHIPSTQPPSQHHRPIVTSVQAFERHADRRAVILPGMIVPGGNAAAEGEALGLLIDAVQDYAIFMLTPEGFVQTWNPGAQRIKGYSAEEIIGQHFSVFYTPDERDAGRPMRLLGEAADRGRFEDEGWRVRADGTRFWADVVVTAVRDRSGELYGFAKITRDLTERRAAEAQQRDLEIEQEARKAAERALAARDRFLSIASHELKTPIASVQLATDSLRRAKERGSLDEPRMEAALRRLSIISERLGQLVDELLDVSRLTGGHDSLTLARTDLVTLTRDVVSRFGELPGAERLTMEAPTELWLETDASRIDQVVTNLIDNALKYSQAPAPVRVRVAESDGGAEIVVADEGIGLESEMSERLFEAFGRGSNAEHIHGLGLGLFISQQIVRRHGGMITASNRPDGPGAEFRAWLPAHIRQADD